MKIDLIILSLQKWTINANEPIMAVIGVSLTEEVIN